MTAAEDSGKLQVGLPLQMPSQTPGPLAKPSVRSKQANTPGCRQPNEKKDNVQPGSRQPRRLPPFCRGVFPVHRFRRDNTTFTIPQ